MFGSKSRDLKLPRVPLKSVVVIPARLQSTRLPKKLLLRETGKTLIQHTYESAQQAVLPMQVIVATDHESILQTVKNFGGQAKLTSIDCSSGTDRVAQVAQNLSEVDILVNVQGDEPEISGTAIDQLIELLQANPSASMATLATPIREKEKLLDPACVKVVFDDQSRALYFSRSMIPYVRDWNDDLLEETLPRFWQHVGIYAYRREFLLKFAASERSDLEILENLEQLRVLSMGEAILVGQIDEPSIGIDTPEDYALFVRKMAS